MIVKTISSAEVFGEVTEVRPEIWLNFQNILISIMKNLETYFYYQESFHRFLNFESIEFYTESNKIILISMIALG